MDIIVVILIVVLVLAVAGGAWFLLSRQRSQRLREHFGPEYERSIATTDGRRAAEADLRQREKRYRGLDIKPLSDDERQGFADRWTAVQQGFVDDPGKAVRDADGLVDHVMRARGYPLDDFEQRAADISVEHPIVVQRYREARAIAEAHDTGRAGTEELRQAVTSYRALIMALLEPDTAQADAARPVDDARPAADEPRVDGAGSVDGDRVQHDGVAEGAPDADVEPGTNGQHGRGPGPGRHQPAGGPHDAALDTSTTDTPTTESQKEARA